MLSCYTIIVERINMSKLPKLYKRVKIKKQIEANKVKI